MPLKLGSYLYYICLNMEPIFYIIFIIICLVSNKSAQNEINKKDPPIIYDFKELNMPAIPMTFDYGHSNNIQEETFEDEIASLGDLLSEGSTSEQREIPLLSTTFNEKHCEASSRNELNAKAQIRKRQKKYREKNKEKIKEKYEKYYQENKDKLSENKKKYYQENKNKRLEYFKKYRYENKDKLSEYKKKYEQENRDKRIEYKKKYRQINKDKISKRKNEKRRISSKGSTNLLTEYFSSNIWSWNGATKKRQ